MFILKIKQPVIFTSKIGFIQKYQGIAIRDKHALAKNYRQVQQRRGMLFYSEKCRKLGGDALNEIPTEKREFRVVMVSHWLSCNNSYWLGLLLGNKKTFLPPSGVVKIDTSYWECKVVSSCWGV